jgi:hypothetical protein
MRQYTGKKIMSFAEKNKNNFGLLVKDLRKQNLNLGVSRPDGSFQLYLLAKSSGSN